MTGYHLRKIEMYEEWCQQATYRLLDYLEHRAGLEAIGTLSNEIDARGVSVRYIDVIVYYDQEGQKVKEQWRYLIDSSQDPSDPDFIHVDISVMEGSNTPTRRFSIIRHGPTYSLFFVPSGADRKRFMSLPWRLRKAVVKNHYYGRTQS